MAQMCVEQPCTPTNVVWKGGLVRNLPDRDQQRRSANRPIMRPTADSLGRAKRHLARKVAVFLAVRSEAFGPSRRWSQCRIRLRSQARRTVDALDLSSCSAPETAHGVFMVVCLARRDGRR